MSCNGGAIRPNKMISSAAISNEPRWTSSSSRQGSRDFAYLQCYDLTAWNSGFGEHPRGTRGIDQFIGEPDMIERGHGSAFIRAFVDERLRNGAPRIVTDPDPANSRAVRAYEKRALKKLVWSIHLMVPLY
jgi:aminoglycoside 6'-N-acetyltransferase